MWDKHMDTVETETREPFSIWRCQHCGVLRTWPCPSDLGPYYGGKVGELYRQKGAALYEALKTLLLSWEFKHIKHLDKSVTFLDAGCGTGDFTRYVAKQGHRIIATDSAENIPVRLQESGHIPYHMMNFDDYQIAGLNRLENGCVIARHVVEHLRDPGAFIGRMVSYGARHFYFVVPNVTSVSCRLYGQYWFAWDPPRHLWHFNRRSMTQLLEAHHIDTINSGYISSTMMSASAYRYLRITQGPEWLCRLANPKGALSGLIGSALDTLFADSVYWVYGRLRD
jgi:SAM-dependent methyltransferase